MDILPVARARGKMREVGRRQHGEGFIFFFSLLSKIVEKLFEENLDTKGEGGPRWGGGHNALLNSVTVQRRAPR